jgi:hypothetical protein
MSLPMDINAAAEAIDKFLQGYTGAGGRKPVETRVLPSGDQKNQIKVWVNLGAAAEQDDLEAWCTAAETAIRAGVAGVDTSIELRVRADAM